MNQEIKQIEKYVKETCQNQIAHTFEHANRVRNWAIKIAKKEKFENLKIVEIAALMHDIGLPGLEKGVSHGVAGAQKTKKYLMENNFDLTKEEIDEISNAIQYHNTNRTGEGKLLEILRDADMLDGMGAAGLMRSISSAYSKPLLDPKNPKGATWGFGEKDFDNFIDQNGKNWNYITDNINFQISWQENLKTKSAKKFAKPLIKYMKKFMLQLEKEV